MEDNTNTGGNLGQAPVQSPTGGTQAQSVGNGAGGSVAGNGAGGNAPTPVAKVEISQELFQEMVGKIQQIDGLGKAFEELQKKNLELEKQIGEAPKSDAWYEEQRKMFADGRNKKKFVRLLVFGNKYLMGYKNLAVNTRQEVFDKMTPDPNDPKKTIATRTGLFYNFETKQNEEIDVYFPQYIEQCIAEECEVVKEELDEDIFSEGKTIEKTYDEKRGVSVETGKEMELFVKVVRRTYTLKTANGEITISERWVNQK